MTYEIEILLFFFSPYIVVEIIGIIGIVLGAEYYLFVKLIKVEIENKE